MKHLTKESRFCNQQGQTKWCFFLLLTHLRRTSSLPSRNHNHCTVLHIKNFSIQQNNDFIKKKMLNYTDWNLTKFLIHSCTPEFTCHLTALLHYEVKWDFKIVNNAKKEVTLILVSLYLRSDYSFYTVIDHIFF